MYIVLFAMVAGFLAMRLYAVLGKRTGHEQPLPKPAEERPAPPVMPRAIDPPNDSRESFNRAIESGAEPGLRAVIAAEPGFDVATFLDGARAAYAMILDAFWKGDTALLDRLTGDEVRTSFAQAIAERKEAGHSLDNRLVTIERAAIVEAEVEGKVARIAVRFDADIAAVTRDRDGNVIAGSLDDAIAAHDIWTFARILRSDDPNWKLIETDEA